MGRGRLTEWEQVFGLAVVFWNEHEDTSIEIKRETDRQVRGVYPLILTWTHAHTYTHIHRRLLTSPHIIREFGLVLCN